MEKSWASRPCISLKTDVARAKFNALFCLETALDLLLACNFFDEVKYSHRLGILRAYGNKTVTLYKDGAITVKPAGDVQESYLFIRKIGEIIADARLCPRDGDSVFLRCAACCDRECPLRNSPIPSLENERIDLE